MFDTLLARIMPSPAGDGPVPRRGPEGVPLERLEAQICELAGHLAAATCRFLVLLGDFDARRGWASWEMSSCAAWLSWKCQMSSGTAREHVRVARALRDLPVTRAEFAAGRLSYAKVRALTRIATPGTEASLAELAAPMTANQLERFARAHRQVSAVDDQDSRVRRRLAFRFEDDGSLSGTFHLPPLAGAVLLKALRAAAADLEHPDPADREHPTPAAPTGPAEPGTSASRGPASRPAFPRKRRPPAARWRRPPQAWPTRCWLSPRRSWAARPLLPMTRRSTRSSCTSAPTPSPPPTPRTARPPRPETFPRKRGPSPAGARSAAGPAG